MSEVAQAPHSSPDGHIPQLRFPEFSGEWGRKLFNNIVDIIDGDRGVNYPKSNDFFNDEYCLFLSAKNVTKNGFIFNETQFITKERDALLRKGKLSRGDIVLTTRGTVGQFAFYSDDVLYDNIRINSGMVLLRNNNDNLLNSYFFKACKSFQISRQIKIVAFGSAQPQLTVKEINKIKISLPAKPEQQKIAAFLTAVDSKIEQLSKKQELLGEYKKGLMQQIFSQAIRFRAGDTPGQPLLPNGNSPSGSDFPNWEEKRLGDLCEITTGKLDANAMVEGGQYRFYTCAKEYYKIDDYAFDTDALIVSGNGANVGYIHHYQGKFNAYQRTYVLDSFTDNIIFVKFVLDEYLHKRIMKEKNEGNTPYIVMGTLTDMKINLPSFSEQTKIAIFLSSIDSKIEQVGKQLDESKQFKKALLQQMFV